MTRRRILLHHRNLIGRAPCRRGGGRANRGGGHRVAIAPAAEVTSTEAGAVDTTGAAAGEVDTESSTSNPETAGDTAGVDDRRRRAGIDGARAADARARRCQLGATTAPRRPPRRPPHLPTRPPISTRSPARSRSPRTTCRRASRHTSSCSSATSRTTRSTRRRATLPDTVGFACTTDLSDSGQTSEALAPFRNFWFVTNPPIEPGATGGDDFDYRTTDADAAAGTVTCEGVLLTLEEPANVISLIGRLTNVAPVALTVSSASTSTTAG